MGKTRKRIWQLLISAALLAFALMIFFHPRSPINPKELKKKDLSLQELPIKAKEILPFIKANGFSTELAILVDMKLNLHQKRMYAINPETSEVLHSCIVSHGKGGESTKQDVRFSNVPESWCSSLGKYKIAERYTGRWGDSYRLDGLDASNSNARKRAIVFHYYEYQSADESVGPHYFSEGCPMLEKKDWVQMDALIQADPKPILLWIYK